MTQRVPKHHHFAIRLLGEALSLLVVQEHGAQAGLEHTLRFIGGRTS